MIFTLKDNIPQITPEALTIPEMRAIWDSEDDKSVAHKRLCYIYHMADPKSPYAKLPEDEKESTILKDFFGNAKHKSTDADKEAITKYQKLTESPALRYLRATEYAMDSISKMIKGTDITLENFKDIVTAIEKGEKFISSYQRLLDTVEKEIATSKKRRGGVKPSIFEDQ